jgi:GNAT superfamily N-acetyltransferase
MSFGIRDALLQPNIAPQLLTDLKTIIERRNQQYAKEPGCPQVQIVESIRELRMAAELLAATFVRSCDRAWICWLPRRTLGQIAAGDFTKADRKLARIINYLIATSMIRGGVVVVETAEQPAGGGRTMRGVVVRQLPPRVKRTEPLLRRYLLGGFLALRSYGVRRALAADRASQDLDRATEDVTAAHGIPDGCVRGGGIAVRPEYRGLRVSSRLASLFQELADRNGLWSVLQSSSPECNDERVFHRWGYRLIGHHHYGVSPHNGVGSYILNIMARCPRLTGDEGARALPEDPYRKTIA